VSADLALAADASVVDRVTDPAGFIIAACERARSWLAVVLEEGDIDAIVECKSQAEAIRVYTMSRQLGKEARLAATEIVRRAERGIGQAIRRGQEEGSIRRQGQSRIGQRQHQTLVASPTDFATHGELIGSRGDGIYDMTDGVTDEQFEDAIARARAEQDLSRANTVRKIRSQHAPGGSDWIPAASDRGTAAAVRRRELIAEMAAENYSSRQISERLGTLDGTIRKIARTAGIAIPADAVIANTRGLDSNRIVRETVHSLEGLAMGAQLVEAAALDPSQADGWATSLAESIRVLNRLIRTLKEISQP